MIIIREGPGLGDLVMCLGAIQGWKALAPDEPIRVIATRPLLEILERHPAIAQAGTREEIPFDPAHETVFRLSDPCPAAWREVRCGSNVWTGRIDLFAEACGDIEPEIPRLYLSAEERAWGRDYLDEHLGPESGGDFAPRVALVLRCAEVWRDLANSRPVIEALRARGIRVLTIDHERSLGGVPHTRGLGIRQLASVIAAADMTVTPDTGWLHVAGALRKPIFGLFGSVDPEVRQRPWPVPGGWWRGSCPHGRQPCWYDICVSKEETPPCLEVCNKAVELISSEIAKILQNLGEAGLLSSARTPKP